MLRACAYLACCILGIVLQCDSVLCCAMSAGYHLSACCHCVLCRWQGRLLGKVEELHQGFKWVPRTSRRARTAGGLVECARVCCASRRNALSTVVTCDCCTSSSYHVPLLDLPQPRACAPPPLPTAATGRRWASWMRTSGARWMCTRGERAATRLGRTRMRRAAGMRMTGRATREVKKEAASGRTGMAAPGAARQARGQGQGGRAPLRPTRRSPPRRGASGRTSVWSDLDHPGVE